MSSTNPIQSKTLTKQQIVLLQTLYKFRHATAQLITDQQQAKHKRVILKRLQILEKDKYIGKIYESSYKLQGKPASYHLLLDGVRYLRNQPYTSRKVLTNAYYDRTEKAHIIEHYLHVFKTHNELNKQYPGTFHFFSQSELREKAHFPKPRPDAYIKRIKPSTKKPNDYFLLCFEDGGYWTHRRRIRTIIEYTEREIWEKATGKPFPAILVVCESDSLRRGMQNLITKELDTTYVDLNFIITAETYEQFSSLTQD